MDGRRANQGEWTEVRRRKKPIQNMETNANITSFYVSNLPDNVSKIKIRNSFQVFGKVADIYIGGKRDRSGSMFAFVRFEGVKDAKILEMEMSRVRCEHCILKVNIAKYMRKSNAPTATRNHVSLNGAPAHPTHNGHYFQPTVCRPQGNKTFAEAVAGQKFTSTTTTRHVIDLKPIKITRNWDDCVLTGEVLNAQLIADIPTILQVDGNASGRVYYTGGLRILIKFNNKKEVESFYAND